MSTLITYERAHADLLIEVGRKLHGLAEKRIFVFEAAVLVTHERVIRQLRILS